MTLAMKTKLIHNIFIPIALFTIYTISQASEYDGKTSRQILDIINQNHRPSSYIEKHLGKGGMWEAMYPIYTRDDGSLEDAFSSSHEFFPGDDIDFPPSGIEALAIVPGEWWGEVSEYRTLTGKDLHNIVIANLEVRGNKRSYPVGEVTDTLYGNGTWAAGIGLIYGQRTNVYSPAKEYRGDFARIIMYMAAVYPMELWSDYAPMMFSDGKFPGLNDYGKQILMKWHRQDPVDAAETARDIAISAIQGNRNPFVERPDLAEYVWGDKSGQPYSPPEQQHRTAIKPTYSISGDQWLDLYSPYIPEEDGPEWFIDGEKVSGTKINLVDLGTGKHEIMYRSSTGRGKIMITVTE